MVFSAEEFMSDPKREAVEALQKKSELLMPGKYLNLEVKMLTFEIRNVIVAHLVDGESLYEDALDLVKAYGVDTVKMREIEMQEKIRLKKKRKNDKLKNYKYKKKERLKKCKCN
jgi:hypothetical protein